MNGGVIRSLSSSSTSARMEYDNDFKGFNFGNQTTLINSGLGDFDRSKSEAILTIKTQVILVLSKIDLGF